MTISTNDAYNFLSSVRHLLTRQQHRTIRGQLRAGDVDGAVRGIKRMMEVNTKATKAKAKTNGHLKSSTKRRSQMKIPIYCEHCGKLIATFDTSRDTSVDWAESPCGKKVCEKCCDECENQLDDHACIFRR